MGLTQHKNAVATIQEIMNFLLLRRQYRPPGRGPLSGSRSFQCAGRSHHGHMRTDEREVHEKTRHRVSISVRRRNTAPTPWRRSKQMHRGHIRVFIAMGGNFLSAAPDTEYTAKALRRCRLTAHVATKLNRSHLVTGEIALILPCLGPLAKSIGRQRANSSSRSRIRWGSSILRAACSSRPASNCCSEPAIVAGLARATLGDRSAVDWEGTRRRLQPDPRSHRARYSRI